MRYTIRTKDGIDIPLFKRKKTVSIVIDHKDRNRDNNEHDNLRIATWSENNCNRGNRSDNTLGYKGLFKRQLKRRIIYGWMIKKDGKCFSKSGFKTKEEAYIDRCKKLEYVHGDFACTG